MRNNSLRVYRIDNRVFDTGDTIDPQREYQDKLDGKRKSVENLLEQHRPHDKPARGSVLMLFEDFEDAKRHWTIQSNSKFYQLEIDETDILHTGDYNKVEQLFNNIDDNDKATQIAHEYWQGLMTAIPKPELFVKSATVKNIISNIETERKNAFAIRAGLPPQQGIRLITEVEQT